LSLKSPRSRPWSNRKLVSTAVVVTDVVSVLGVLGLGSVLGQYLASSKDRREARARVLSALAQVEQSRWVGAHATASLAEFETALRDLETAALVARLPRSSVLEYEVLAQSARRLSAEDWDRTVDPETGGGIDAYMADATREAARTIAELAWSWGPTHRWRSHRSKKRVDRLVARLQSEDTVRALERSRDHGIV
jgi:hypothetical protein